MNLQWYDWCALVVGIAGIIYALIVSVFYAKSGRYVKKEKIGKGKTRGKR